MRFVRSKGFISVGLGLVLCFVTACHHQSAQKKLSPEAARQARLDWNLKTLVGSYQDVGNTDAKWDEYATNALNLFAQIRAASTSDDYAQYSIATNCDAAIQAGCDDPMIRYLHLRYPMKQAGRKEYADALSKVEYDMQQSGYPAIRKFYLSLRALEQVYLAYPRKELDRKLTGELADDLLANLAQSVGDKNAPLEEIYQACDQGLGQMKGSKDWYERCYSGVESALFKNWPDEAIPWLLLGQVEIDRAWFARGNGYADAVTDEQWKGFGEHLAAAEKALNKAWLLDPKEERIARQMITVVLGKSGQREEMEEWFDRAMALKPDNYAACRAKMYYLEPKWHGSQEAMLEFGRECVHNANWSGLVPLMLVEAHQTICRSYVVDTERDGYWKQPEVWTDVKAAYERCLELNPTDTGKYYDYAWYAYQAEQWDMFLTLTPKLGTVNYDYFGGEATFNKMMQTARDHAKAR